MRSVIRGLFFLLLAPSVAFAQGEDPRIAAFRLFAEDAMKAQQVRGFSMAVSHGDFHWSGGIGLADVENDVPASAATSYRMASVTKPMTATAVLKLAEEGRIELDAEVQKYVPWFPRKAHPITVRQLLAHQGGISHYRDYDKEGHIREPKTTREAIEIFAAFDLVAEPGTAYRYTTYGYNLLGAVIEGAAGKPYAEVMREKVWKPLGMASTLMDDPRAVIPHRAPGYVLEDGKLRRSEYVDISSRFAGGGTRSTVQDMVRFMEGLAAGKVLGSAMLDRAWTALPTRDGNATTYGLGFGVYPRNGRWVVAHTGSQQEARTRLAHVPRARFTVALATNFEHANLGAFEDALFEIFLGEPALVGLTFDDAADERAWEAMESVYSNGMAWYDRHGRAMTADRRELAAAFRTFHEAAGGDAEKLAGGHQPKAGEPFVKAGSYMASALAAHGSLERYRREGALAFFSDYARLAKQHKLGRGIVERVARWSDERAHVWPAEVAAINPSDPRAWTMLERSAPALAKSSVKPDFREDLLQFAERNAMRGDVAAARKAALLGVSLYPRSPGLSGLLGVLTLLSGDSTRARDLLRKSHELEPDGYTRPDNLLDIATFLSIGPTRPAAIALLQAGLELHPGNERLARKLKELAP